MCKPIVFALMALPMIVTPAYVLSVASQPIATELRSEKSASILLATRDQQTQECRWLGTCIRR